MRSRKVNDPDYIKFVVEFKRNHESDDCRKLAEILFARYGAKVSDYKTPLSRLGHMQGRQTGDRIFDRVPQPDVIFVSPYVRTRDTLANIMSGKPELFSCPVIIEDRIREQEHGLQLVYGDWRIFQTFHPEQKRLHDLQGPYWYQYPGGESVSMVRERIRSMLNMLVREYSGAHVWLVSHHLTKLSIRANLERLSPEEFMQIDNDDKPINCGVTTYIGNPDVGKDGRLELRDYNLKFYDC